MPTAGELPRDGIRSKDFLRTSYLGTHVGFTVHLFGVVLLLADDPLFFRVLADYDVLQDGLCRGNMHCVARTYRAVACS